MAELFIILCHVYCLFVFFFQAEDGIRDHCVTGVQTCALPISGKREGGDARCKLLAEHGYAAATATYRLAPKSPFPAAVEDVKAAVRWLRANAEKYALDPDRIGVVGDSAGGHLAQFLGVTGGVSQ